MGLLCVCNQEGGAKEADFHCMEVCNQEGSAKEADFRCMEEAAEEDTW